MSEHGFGNAVDVESDDNPDIPGKTWEKLEQFTGKTVDRSPSRGSPLPKHSRDDIYEINRLYVKKLNESADQASAAGAVSGKKDTRTEEAIKKASRLKTARSLGMGRRINGFFTLEWPLVEAFHKNGFKWGATFEGRRGKQGKADLMHFEL